MSELDLSRFLPSNSVPVKVGEERFSLSMDVPAVVFSRAQQWIAEQAVAEDGQIEAIEQRGIDLVMRVLKHEDGRAVTNGEASTFGPMVRRGIINFLSKGVFPSPPTTTP